MNRLSAGFSRVNITPMLGITVTGYYKPRFAEGVLDELEINALALAVGETRVVLMSMDNCGCSQDINDRFRSHVSDVTGLPTEAIFIHCTHTHTGPSVRHGTGDPLVSEYRDMVCHKMGDAAQMALADLKPARMGFGVGEAKNIAFVRRYRMKDGKIRTNPGVNNPDIVEPIGNVDERVNVLRFERENGDNIVLVNFGDHPDTVGGSKISADWPGFLRRRVEKSLDNVKCLFFNGAQGDINHVNVHPNEGDFNDMFNDFDDVSRGYGHARHMGNVVAGAVLSVYDKVNWQQVDSLKLAQLTMQVPSSRPTAEELPRAREIEALHVAGHDDQIPFKGMELTTVVAEAERMLRLENGPDAFEMRLIGVAIGELVLIGIPGEPFNGIGLGLKQTEGWKLILPCCLTNGSEGYFPMQEAYDEGGYESRSSPFKAGVAEYIIEKGTELLNSLR